MSYQRSITNLFRAPWLIAGITLCITLLTVMILTITSIVQSLGSVEKSLSERLTIPVYLAQDRAFGDEDVEHFIGELQSVSSEKHVLPRTREEALRLQLERNPEGIDSLGAGNPYPDSLLLIPSESTLLGLQKTVRKFEYLTQKPAGVQSYNALFAKVDETYQSFQTLRNIGVVLVVLFLAAIFSVMYMGTRAYLSHFKSELEVGHLVGANKQTLLQPFFIQISILVIASWLIAQILVWLRGLYLEPLFADLVGGNQFTLHPSSLVSILVLIGLLCIGGLSVVLSAESRQS